MSSSAAALPAKLRPLLWLLAAFLLVYSSQISYDVWLRFSPSKLSITYNDYIEPQPLSPAATRAASFGATEFAADLYWLKLIQYYGGGDPQGKYRKLAELFNTITDLSPRFAAAYQTGLIVLPGEGNTNEALALADKGKKNLPTDWEMPYYKGLVYHIYLKDYVRAAAEFTEASALPGAPDSVKLFAGIYFKQADQRTVALQIFQTVYQSATDPYIKDRAKKYIDHLAGLFYLQDGVSSFKQKFGRFPSSLAELAATKTIEEVPVSPLGIQYLYDPATGQITEGK